MLFCTTCMGRGAQLLVSLAVNLAVAFPRRRCVKFCVLLLGQDDQSTWENIQSRFQWALDSGFLLVASGGAAGRAAARDNGVDAPTWMPHRPGAPVAGTGRAGPQQLVYWHASWAKNGARQFAMWAAGNSLKVLVNLDCDNLMTPEYISGVASHFRRGKDTSGLCVVCRAVDAALTGRMAYRPFDFLYLRGYDTEGTQPAACEDVDLRERLLALAKLRHGVQDKSAQRPSLVGPTICGDALANDFTNLAERVDRSIAKLANCDPAVLARFGEAPAKRFGKMCDAAWREVYSVRLEEGRDQKELGGEVSEEVARPVADHALALRCGPRDAEPEGQWAKFWAGFWGGFWPHFWGRKTAPKMGPPYRRYTVGAQFWGPKNGPKNGDLFFRKNQPRIPFLADPGRGLVPVVPVCAFRGPSRRALYCRQPRRNSLWCGVGGGGVVEESCASLWCGVGGGGVHANSARRMCVPVDGRSPARAPVRALPGPGPGRHVGDDPSATRSG